MTDPSFVHLHVHTEFSALDGLSRVSGVVSAAAADGQPAVAITDHGTLAGAYTLAQEAKAAGIKPIIGIEAYLAIGDRHERNTVEVPPEDDAVDTDAADEVAGKTKTKRYEHVTLLATSKQGWASLVSIHNASQESRWGKHPRIDYDLLAEHPEGIIVLTGCLGGPVLGPVARGDVATARENLQRLVAIMGRENVYVEVMEHDIPIESRALPVVADLADEVGVQLVATNDSHYTHEDDGRAHEAWLALQTGKNLTDPSPPRFAFTGSGFHVRTGAEMRGLRDEDWWTTACDNTVRVAGRVEDDILPDSYLRLPKFPVPERFKDARAYFIHLVKEGAQRRYGDPLPQEVRDRLNLESKVIRDFGIVDYFLIVHELISWSRSQGIEIGPGRGSAGGSCTAFALGIVDVDPIRFDLLFERFLDPTRVGMPDIDIDFEKGRRDEVLSHLRDVYGEDHVARIGTFQVSKTKQAIKSAGQVLGTHPRVTNELTKLIPMEGVVSHTFAQLDAGHEKAAKSFWDLVEREGAYGVVDLARSFEEVVRGQSIHACGVVVSDEPLSDLIPLRKDTGAGSHDDDPLVTEWDADGVEGIGLLKLDVLGLRNLDIVSQALDSVAQVTGERLAVEDIPDGDDLDDPRVRAAWRLLGEGHTQGIFQMECVTGRTLVSGRPIERLYADQEAGNALDKTFSVYLNEGRVGRNNIRGIVKSGPKPVSMLVTESGRFVEATGGHRFMTQDGWRELDDIKPGDRVLVDPSAQTRTVAGHATPEFFIPERTVWEEVVRICDEGVQDTYDIAMQAPAHNYLANGFMVHNSGGMTALSRDVQPSSMEHMSALVALYRPGPLSANMHAHYADRKNGREMVDYGLFSDDLAEQDQIAAVLGNTFGLCIAKGQRVHSVTRGSLVPIEHVVPGEVVQGVAADNTAATGTVTRVMDNGIKPIVEARFGGGFTLRSTADHRVLTPQGWKPLNELGVGDLVATPKEVISSDTVPTGLNAAGAKMLGYLIANGSLTFGSQVHLSTTEDVLAEGFSAAVGEEFPTCHTGSHVRPNGVRTIWVTNGNGNGGKAGPMLTWMRELGLKYPMGAERGGVRSAEKFIPEPWLASAPDLAAALLAALWDCDGHVSTSHGVRYKTVSPTLADDVRYLLLRLGVPSTVTRSTYTGGDGVSKDAFDVLVSRFGVFAETVGQYLAHPSKREQAGLLVDRTAHESLIPRSFLREAVSGVSVRGLCDEHNIPRSTFTSALRYSTERAARPVYEATGDGKLGELLNARWVKLEDVSSAGDSRVWDLEVEGIQSFVANGVIVHNCVYQEQMMLLGDVVAGFGPAERNRLRKGVSKKIASEVEAVGELFMAGAVSDTASDGSAKLAFDEGTAARVWETIEGGADYAFNASHSAAYGQLAYVTAFLKANWPAAYGAAVLANTDGEDKRAASLWSLTQEGIDVRPPEINTSAFVTTAIEDRVVVLGMGEVKGVGKAAEVIIAERDANGGFSSVADVFSRTKGLTVTTLAGLIEAGACDEFGPRLAQLRVLRALRAHPDTPVGVEEWGLTERAVRQHERLGLIVGTHPMSGRGLGPQLKQWNPDITDKGSGDTLGTKPKPLHRVMACGEGQVLTVGLVTRWDMKAGRDGGRRAEVTLAGSRTQVEAMVWPRTMRSVQRLDPPVGVGTVAGVLATIRTREVEQVDDEGNDEVVEVRNLSVDRVWPIEFTDVGEVAEAPAGLGFDVGAALFDPSAAVPAPVLPSLPAEPAPEPVVEPDVVKSEDFDDDWSSDGARPARRGDASRGAVGVAERTKKRTHRPGPVDKDTVVDPVGGKVLRMRETGRLSVEAPKGVYRHWGLVSPPTEFGHQALLSEPDVYRITAADGGVLTIVVVPMGHDLNEDVDTSAGEWVPFGGCDHWQRLSRG